MRFTHLDLYDGKKWFISLNRNGNYYHNDDIDQFLQYYSNWSFVDIVLKFGAYVDDDHDYEEYFFEYESDCVRCMNFLNELIK